MPLEIIVIHIYTQLHKHIYIYMRECVCVYVCVCVCVCVYVIKLCNPQAKPQMKTLHYYIYCPVLSGAFQNTSNKESIRVRDK